MTEEQIKEMLNGIINNGEKWEGRKKKLVMTQLMNCTLILNGNPINSEMKFIMIMNIGK